MLFIGTGPFATVLIDGTSVCLVSFFLLVEMTLRRVKRVLIVKRDE